MSDAVDPEERPELQSRWRRLVAYLRYNSEQIVVDVAILSAWTLASATVFQLLGLPRWLHYLVLFLGVVAYSRLTPTWRRPYESPD